jgi:PAS domain S-box-containing protein
MTEDRQATPERPSVHHEGTETEDPQVAWDRFMFAMQGAHDGFYEWNLLTDEVYLSPRWKEILGYNDAELSNSAQTWIELMHPEDREQATIKTHRLLAGEISQYQIDFRLRHKDGSYRWIRSTGASLRNATGKPIRLGGWHIDLTELRRVSERLHQQSKVANLFADVSLALAGRPSWRVFFQHCVDALLAHVPLIWVGIWIQEPGRHGFVPQTRASHTPGKYGETSSLPLGALTVERIAASEHRLVSQEAQHDPFLQPEEQAWAEREGMSVFVGYPLPGKSGVVGVLALFAYEPLSETFLEALGTLALIIGRASEYLLAGEDHV